MMWETELEWREDCPGFQHVRIKQTELVRVHSIHILENLN